MSRKEQLDELLREKLSYVVSSEIPLENGLVSISKVDCALDLSNAKIEFSVIPDNKTGTVLRELKRKTVYIANELKKRGNFRKIPKLKWIYNPTERKASEIDKVFSDISE